jgi:hypothetical protein
MSYMLYNKVTMIRTQVYLRGDQERKIKLKAKQEQKAEAELIRELLDKGWEATYGAGERGLSTGDALLGLAKLGEELGLAGPTDLSSSIDDMLYGENK